MLKTIQTITARPVFPHRLKVAAYARVSTGKDAMLHSLSAQVSQYSKLIQSNPEWEYCGVYVDEAMTGTTDQRDGFQRLLTDCRGGKINLVITKSISRFARNTVTLLETVRELKALGVDVFFEEQNLHSSSADGELMLTILASYAQEESRSASENQKWRIRHSFEQGQLQCLRTMFGYAISRDSITVNEEEAIIVREIFTRALAGESFSAIAKDLAERHIPGPLGAAWPVPRIREILQNEKYTGNALLQKTFINNHLEKKRCINTGELPRYFVTDTHPSIIGQVTFDQAQVLLHRVTTQTKLRRKPRKCEFTGRIHCPHCGNTYTHVTSSGSKGWRCGTYQIKGKAFCQSKKIPDDSLHNAAAAAMGMAVYDADAFIRLVDHIEVPADHVLRFLFRDGHVEDQTWADRSRRDGWTREMKEQARQHAMKWRKA